MNCIIVDDEPLAIDLIEQFVSKVSFLTLVGKCSNAFEALEAINKKLVDLVFLDIQMPNLTGVEFVKTLSHPPMIIFTTAYSNYALDGFELSAVDYLVKPIPFDRFMKSVNKAYELFQLRKNTQKQESAEPHSLPASDDKYIMVKSDYSVVKIALSEILYVEGLKDYLKIFTSRVKPILTLNSLKKFEDKLPSSNFIRVHRSYIVAIDKIESIQKHRIHIGKELIPIGDLYKESFYSKIEKGNLL